MNLSTPPKISKGVVSLGDETIGYVEKVPSLFDKAPRWRWKLKDGRWATAQTTTKKLAGDAVTFAHLGLMRRHVRG